MRKKHLVIFDGNREIHLKPCGCNKGKVKKEHIRLRDVYSNEECIQMGEDPDASLDHKYVCDNCGEELEEIT